MLDILKKVGLESAGVETPEINEFEADMAGMESFLDLQESLEVAGYAAACESLEEVHFAMADKAGEGKAEAVLAAVGFESEEIGLEAAAVDVAARQYYRIKTAVKGLIRVIINFLKKFTTLGQTTDKAMKGIKTKHKAYAKKWGSNIGKVKLDTEKEYKTKIGSIAKALSPSNDSADFEAIQAFVVSLSNINDIAGLKGLIKTSDGDGSVKLLKKFTKKESLKEAKEGIKEMISGLDSDDLKATEWKTKTKSALDTVGTSATKLADAKFSQATTKAIKALQKVESKVSKLKADEIATQFKADGSFDTFLGQITKLSESLAQVPVLYGMMLKAQISLSQKVFTEVDRILAM